MQVLSPAAVAANRKARLSVPPERKPRIYTTTTGDAPRGPSWRERKALESAERAVSALHATVAARTTPCEYSSPSQTVACGDCIEHAYTEAEQAERDRLWAEIDRLR